MCNVWVASDWHLWSKKQNGRHPFVSAAQIDQMISNYAKQIQPTDIFIYLGDLCDPEVADIKKLQFLIGSIPGYKVLCRGDHDTEIPEFYLNLGFDDVCDICKCHSIIFSHMPVKVAPDMINIHGDSHSRKQTNLGYQHICVYDEEETMCPKLVDDLLQIPSTSNIEKYHASEEDIDQNIYRTYNGDALVNITSISHKVTLYPMDEAAAHSNVYAAMDLQELQTPQQLYDWMRKNIHYGNFTRLKTDVQLLKSHSGSCHDQVYFAYPRLRQMGVNPKILFFVEYKKGSEKGGMTHTLIYWKDEHDDDIFWFETSWGGQQGIRKYKSMEDLKKYITDAHNNMPSAKNFPELYFKIVPFNRFKAGMTLQELVKAIMEGDELDESTEIVYGDIILESVSNSGLKSGESCFNEQEMRVIQDTYLETVHDPMNEIIFDDFSDVKLWLADDDVEMLKPKHEPMAESKIKFVNDKGEDVPKVCPKCGSKVGIFLQGEPVFLCTNKKCKKYFGTVPCDLNESVRELAKAGKPVSIYRIHAVSADDEMEPAGAPFSNSVNGAVENYRLEHWKSKEPPAEVYVHMPDLGYYDFRMSDEYSDSWWSPNNIPIKMVGKIKINKDWSWEWVTGYNDDGTVVKLNEAATENKPEKYKSLSSFKCKVCDEGEFAHWKEKFPEELSRLDPDVNTTVTLWMTKDESKLVAYIALEQKGNQTIMKTLGIFPDYRSYGLDKQLMKYAKINGATLLYVNPSNKTAVELYKSCGWKFAEWKNRGMVQPMVLEESAVKIKPELRVVTKHTTNPNDNVSSEAVALNFYDDKDHIGEVYISAVDTEEGFVYNLEVFKKYRGKGYGRQIMEYVLTHYDVTDLTVDLDNKIAINLYKSLGFKLKKKTTDPVDNATVYWFHRELDTPINEDAAQLQGYDRKQQEDVSKKYGIHAVGHDEPEDTPEKRVDQRREKQLKYLKKARKVKQRKAFVRKVKSKIPGMKKNEDVDISDIPSNSGETNFFDGSVAAFDFQNETGYQFQLAENIKFFDKIDESASEDTKLYPVYIMLMHSGTALATVIKTVTQSHFSHSSISFDSSMKNMYSFGRKMDTNPFIGSFKKENIHDDFFKGKSIPYALYVVPCTKNEIDLMKKRLDYFIKNATKFHYDFTGLFKNYLGIADNPEYKWFCSRFVADILNAGRPSSDPYVVEPSLMKPEDFLYTNFAIYVTGGLLDAYDQNRVDVITRRILRVEEIKRRKERQIVQNEAVDIFDLDPFDPLQEAVLAYHLSALSENAFGDFMNYLKSFKVRFDKDGNVIITRREYDQLDKHFRQSLRMIKAYEKANDLESVKEELCKIYYMIGLINQHYLNPAHKQNKTVKSDIRKEMMDLRSVMMNVFQQHLKYITTQDPKFNFQQYYNKSKYSSTVEIPNTVISAVGKALVTGLK